MSIRTQLHCKSQIVPFVMYHLISIHYLIHSIRLIPVILLLIHLRRFFCRPYQKSVNCVDAFHGTSKMKGVVANLGPIVYV